MKKIKELFKKFILSCIGKQEVYEPIPIKDNLILLR